MSSVIGGLLESVSSNLFCPPYSHTKDLQWFSAGIKLSLNTLPFKIEHWGCHSKVFNSARGHAIMGPFGIVEAFSSFVPGRWPTAFSKDSLMGKWVHIT